MLAETIASASRSPAAIRRSILEMLHRARASHLGPCMSVVEALAAIYASVDLEPIRRRARDRSRVIVSKGHCAAAVYATLAHYGLLSFDQLQSYCADGSLLAGHVSHAVDGVEHSTGALGHGLPVACGCAFGLRNLRADHSHVYCLVGDGEMQEGSNWEAIMLAAHHRLSNLTLLVDSNRISSITATANVINLFPLEDRFQAFGWTPYAVDGHSPAAIADTLARIRHRGELAAVVCNTIKGYGVPFAENQPIWHYRSLNDDLFQQALTNLDEAVRS